MNILQNRIDSFQNNLVKWPHNNNNKFPKVESFAKAGFYFARRPKTADSVRCFICDIELGNWRSNQSPFIRHGTESPHCAWKRLNFPDAHKKPLANNPNANGRPRSITMRSARLATFNNHNYWPPKKGTTKYPTSAKLAGAGFFFSPTATQPSLVKCAYCGVSATVTPNNEDMLIKHQELSEDCIFFEQIHSTRTSSLKDDESNSNISTPKRRNSAVSSSSETSTKKPPSKRLKDDTKRLEPVIVIESKKKPLSKNTPLSSINTTTTTTATATTATNKKTNNTNDSVWDFNQVLGSTSKTRRPMITYGSSRPVYRTLPNRKDPGVVNILPDFKSSLIVKPVTGPLVEPQVIQKMTRSEAKKTVKATEGSQPTQPVIRKRLLKDRAKTPINKSSPVISTKMNVAKKRNISASLAVDNETSDPNKLRRVNVVTDNNQHSPPTPQKPFRDKGKGRAVEYYLTTNSSRKKPLSLSRPSSRLQRHSSLVNPPFEDISNTPIQELDYNIPMVNTSNLFTPECSDSAASTSKRLSYKQPFATNVNASSQKQQFDTNIDTSSVSTGSPQLAASLNTQDINKVSPKHRAQDLREVSPLLLSQGTETVTKSPVAQDDRENSPEVVTQNIKETSPPLMGQNAASSSFKTQDDKAISPEMIGFSVNLNEPSSPVYQDIMDSQSNMLSPILEGSFPPVVIPYIQSPVYMPQSPSPEYIPPSPPMLPDYSPMLPKSPSPVYMPDSPSVDQECSPSPPIQTTARLSSPLRQTPPPPDQIRAFDISRMQFLQSTPTHTENRLASGYDLFGPNPLSPILPSPNAPQFNELQDTPILTESRTRQLIVEDEEGTPHLVRQTSIKNEEDGMDNVGETLSDCLNRNRDGTIENHVLSLVENSVQQIESHGLDKIKSIQESYERAIAELVDSNKEEE